MTLTRAQAEQFDGLLHYRFDKAYCLPKSPTGHYYRVERYGVSVPYVATFDNRESALRFAKLVSKSERYDAYVTKLNA